MKHAFTSLLVTAIGTTTLLVSSPGETISFLVAERPQLKFYNDSYVVPISRPEHIEHARRLIKDPQTNDFWIPIAKFVVGKDGANRNYLAAGAPEWSWHAFEFLGFTGSAIPEWPNSPTQVEQAPEVIHQWPNGFGMFSYTIVAELGPALVLTLRVAEGKLRVNWPDIGANYVYTLESKSSLQAAWAPVPGGEWPSRITEWTLNFDQNGTLLRVRADLASP